MHANRPKIKIPLAPLDVALEFLTLFVLIILWCYVLMYYAALPDIVPTHFNGSGEVDGTGGKNSLWFLLAITTVITLGIHILTKYPHIHNYLVEITEKNAAYHYKISSRLLRFINLLTLLIMSYVAYSVIATAMGEKLIIGSWFLYATVGLSVLTPIFLIIYLLKNKKDKLSKK